MRLRDRIGARRDDTRWPADRPVRFITSFNEVFFDASGRRCIETFRDQNPSYEIRAYVEADTEQAVARIGDDLEALGARWSRLDRRPLLGKFLEIARDVIPRELGGDAPPELFPGEGPEAGDVWFRKHMFRWFRKMVALDDAADGFEGVLFWMDCDCFSTKPLPLAVLERAFNGAGVVHMKARRRYSETGVVGYDLAMPGVRRLLDAMKQHYLQREFLSFPRWDDCITLDLCLARPGAPAARDIARRVSGHGDVLPSTILGDYLTHDKGLHSRQLGLVR